VTFQSVRRQTTAPPSAWRSSECVQLCWAVFMSVYRTVYVWFVMLFVSEAYDCKAERSHHQGVVQSCTVAELNHSSVDHQQHSVADQHSLPLQLVSSRHNRTQSASVTPTACE